MITSDLGKNANAYLLLYNSQSSQEGNTDSNAEDKVCSRQSMKSLEKSKLTQKYFLNFHFLPSYYNSRSGNFATQQNGDARGHFHMEIKRIPWECKGLLRGKLAI